MALFRKTSISCLILIGLVLLGGCGDSSTSTSDSQTPATGDGGTLIVAATKNDAFGSVPWSIETTGGTVIIPSTYHQTLINALANGTFTSAQLDLFVSETNLIVSMVAATDATSFKDLTSNYPDVTDAILPEITATASAMGCKILIGEDTISVSQNGIYISTAAGIFSE